MRNVSSVTFLLGYPVEKNGNYLAKTQWLFVSSKQE